MPVWCWVTVVDQTSIGRMCRVCWGPRWGLWQRELWLTWITMADRVRLLSLEVPPSLVRDVVKTGPGLSQTIDPVWSGCTVVVSVGLTYSSMYINSVSYWVLGACLPLAPIRGVIRIFYAQWTQLNWSVAHATRPLIRFSGLHTHKTNNKKYKLCGISKEIKYD